MRTYSQNDFSHFSCDKATKFLAAYKYSGSVPGVKTGLKAKDLAALGPALLLGDGLENVPNGNGRMYVVWYSGSPEYHVNIASYFRYEPGNWRPENLNSNWAPYTNQVFLPLSVLFPTNNELGEISL